MDEQIADIRCELIGGMPLVRLGRLGQDLPGEIVGMLELSYPLANVKHRIGLAMIEQAEKGGLIRSGGTVAEPRQVPVCFPHVKPATSVPCRTVCNATMPLSIRWWSTGRQSSPILSVADHIGQ